MAAVATSIEAPSAQESRLKEIKKKTGQIAAKPVSGCDLCPQIVTCLRLSRLTNKLLLWN